ncbi:bifunctional riboflavin kinase/FAD synthetase [bacterium]|nr:bifunctional riboflavin kinase/FAD synthetase [bacterium]
MDIFNKMNGKSKNLSVALGFFDGIHIGHRAVLNSAVSYAKKHNLNSMVITFNNHPKCFLKNVEPEYILTKQEKIKIFKEIGFDDIQIFAFDEILSNFTAEEYLDYICQRFAPKAIFTGFNHTFGAKKTGNAEFLKENQKKYGYEYFEIAPVEVDGEVVSSSKIRENLKLGNVELVNKMLGYNYFLEETVVEGEKIGRTIGFKTANLLYPKNMLHIARGVYSVFVEYSGQKYRGIANFGMRPSLGNTKVPILEVHILNFEKDIYGEKIKVEFIKKIRDEKKFGSLEELKNQISKDVKAV